MNIPSNLYEFKRLDPSNQWDYLVVGDLKTNHDAVSEVCHEVGGLYLTPADQEKLGFTHSAAIGWNCIERKNIGYLFALKNGYDLVGSLDDDNFPTDGWFEGIKVGDSEEDVYKTDTGWLNAADWADAPYKLRGFPISMFHTTPSIEVNRAKVRVGVQSGLVLGDPDTDAISRIVNKPNVTNYSRMNFCLSKGTMCPYNTQNTILVKELVPANMMWAGCGRYDDIFASYVGQIIAWRYGYSVRYGDPLAKQERNQHDLVKDLEEELLGMRVQSRFLEAIANISLVGPSPVHDLRHLVHTLVGEVPSLPRSLRHMVDTWFFDISRILSEG